MITARAPKRPALRGLAYAAAAVGAIALACATPRPTGLRPAPDAPPLFPPLTVTRPRSHQAQPSPYTRDQMAAAIGRYFPGVARGDTTPITFLLDTDGRVLRTSRGGDAPAPARLLEHVRDELVGAGYYGPAALHVRVYWLKPDSLAGEADSLGLTFSSMEDRGSARDVDTLGARLESQVRAALSLRPDIVGTLGPDETAYVWMVLSASGQLARAGRAESEAAMRAGARLPSASAYFVKRLPPGQVAAGAVVVTAAWEKP